MCELLGGEGDTRARLYHKQATTFREALLYQIFSFFNIVQTAHIESSRWVVIVPKRDIRTEYFACFSEISSCDGCDKCQLW